MPNIGRRYFFSPAAVHPKYINIRAREQNVAPASTLTLPQPSMFKPANATRMNRTPEIRNRNAIKKLELRCATFICSRDSLHLEFLAICRTRETRGGLHFETRLRFLFSSGVFFRASSGVSLREVNAWPGIWFLQPPFSVTSKK
jgi:hypothetical protein